MSSSGSGSNSLSKISSILKYDTTNLNVGLGIEPLTEYKLRVINTSKSWQSALFSTNNLTNANAIGIGNYYDCNINYDINNSNNNATIYATSYAGYGFRDLFLNNFGTNSNLYGNVIIRGKTTIGSYYNSSLYNYSLDINGTNNILNLRNNNNTLNFSIDNSNNFNINTSSKNLYINNNLYTCNLNASNINISYKNPIFDTDKLLVGSGVTKFENNSIVNIGSNNNLNNKLNIYGNLYISSNVGIGTEPDTLSNIKLRISPGTINFTNNSIVNVGNSGINNILNIYGKTLATSTIEIGNTLSLKADIALKTYGTIIFNNTTVGIGTTDYDKDYNNLNVYAKSYFAGNIGIGTIATDENTLKIKAGGNTFFDNNSIITIGNNSKFIIAGLTHLNGNVIIGQSNINALNYGLYINSNVCINNGLTIFTSNNQLVDIKGNINIDSNANVKGDLTVTSNIKLNGNITGNGYGLSNIYLSSIIKDQRDKNDDINPNAALINARFINFDTTYFRADRGMLSFTAEFQSNSVAATQASTIWNENSKGIYYSKRVSIATSSQTDSCLQVGNDGCFIKTSSYNITGNIITNDYPYTKISSDNTITSNTTIKLISSTYIDNTNIALGNNTNINLGSIVYTTTGSYNPQHIFEYNNYNLLESNAANNKQIQMTISKSGIVSINSNISVFVEKDNEKLIVNGSVNILNCNITPTQLILGNSRSNNCVLNAHGSVFVGSNITIGNSLYFNNSSHKSLNRISVASGTTQFSDNTKINIGIGTTSINLNSFNIYSKIGIGTDANKNTGFDNYIYGLTNFYGDNIRFGNSSIDDSLNFNKTRVNFINSYVGIGTIGTTSDLSLYGNILITDGSDIKFGTYGSKNLNKFSINSKVGIGTFASDFDDEILKIGSGNINTDNNIRFNYGTANSNYLNTFNIYSKVGIGTNASTNIDNILLRIGGNSNTINFLDSSTINFGTVGTVNSPDSPYVNIYGKININGSNTIKGNTIIGSDDFTAITMLSNINLHIKTPTKFYNNVYFDNPIYFNNAVNFSQGVNFGAVNTIEFTNLKTSNIDVKGYITGYLSNSDSINNSLTFSKINVDKINYDSEYLTSNNDTGDGNKLTFNAKKYSFWFNNNNNQYISYSNSIFINSNGNQDSFIANNGANFQINVSTSISEQLHIGTKSMQNKINNGVLYVYNSGIFYNALYCSNTANGNPSIFTNVGNTNILQIGTNQNNIPNISGYQLNVNGNIGLTGNIFTNSDLRLKNNISTVNNALEKIINCRGVHFNYLNDSNINIGVIAQEIEKIIPEIVETKNNGFKTVNYLSIIGILIEAIKELNNKIDKLSN
jgi:hypothetical protein